MTKKITWDTTLEPIYYPKEIKNKYFKLSIKLRSKFVDWVGDISFNFRNEYLWWIKLPSSRDPYKSNLFKNILILLILNDQKILRNLECLIFENKSIYKSVNKNKKIDLKKIKIKFKKNNYLLKFINSIIFSFFAFLIVKISTKNHRFSKENYVFINTVVDTKDKIHDFVFPGLYEILKTKKKKNVFFIPNFLVHRNIFNFYKNVKLLSKKDFIFMENFISFNEFLHSMIELLLFDKLNIKKKKFKNFFSVDCSLLIIQEYRSKKDFFSEFQSILKVNFVKKLSKLNLNVVKTICRFENQSIDRSWFYGFRKYFPKVKNLGYQGFLYYPQYLNQSPTLYEEKAKVIPNEILVPGKQSFLNRNEFYKGIKLKIAPSFNRQVLEKKFEGKKVYKFTLALCGIYSLDVNLISWIIFVLSKNNNLRVVIKPHPILSINKFQNLIPKKLLKQIKFSNEPVYRLLQKTEFLISSGPTSIIFESLLYGCKLLYLNLDPSDIYILKKKLIKKKSFEFIRDKLSLFKIMNKYNNSSMTEKKYYTNSFFYSKLSNSNLKFFY